MSPALSKSSFKKFIIKKISSGKIVDLSEDLTANSTSTKVIGINYYESLFSPQITATVSLVDTGGLSAYDSKYDTQERTGTIVSTLPLDGDVEFEIEIESKYGTISNTFLYDTHSSPSEDSNRGVTVINLNSKYEKLNSESTVYETHRGNIGNSAAKLIKDYLNNPPSIVEKTKNSYNFSGESRDVFSVLIDIASKSIPVDGNPGFFFYETQSGFNFRSIDSLISQPPAETYYKNAVVQANLDNDTNDFKILLNTDIKKGSIANLEKTGVLRNRTIFFDPITHEYTEKENTLDLSKTLGRIKEFSDSDSFTRTFFMTKDYGTFDPGVENLLNNDPTEWQAKSPMRYNSLLSQIIHVQVPCNPRLSAGDVIECNFEIISQDEKVLGTKDGSQSGKYLILNLCHHFSDMKSQTSMTLVRDSYG